MNEKAQITFMQTRLLRFASEEWNLPIEQIVNNFKAWNVFAYIESGYGIFHCEGDETILEDIEKFLERKGIKVNAGTV